MNTGSQEEYQVTLFITGRAQNVEQLENCEICTKICGKTVSIDTNRQGCEKDVIGNKITIFSELELATGLEPCEFNEIHFRQGIGLKEFAQNPSLKTLPVISILEKVEASNFNF